MLKKHSTVSGFVSMMWKVFKHHPTASGAVLNICFLFIFEDQCLVLIKFRLIKKTQSIYKRTCVLQKKNFFRPFFLFLISFKCNSIIFFLFFPLSIAFYRESKTKLTGEEKKIFFPMRNSSSNFFSSSFLQNKERDHSNIFKIRF